MRMGVSIALFAIMGFALSGCLTTDGGGSSSSTSTTTTTTTTTTSGGTGGTSVFGTTPGGDAPTAGATGAKAANSPSKPRRIERRNLREGLSGWKPIMAALIPAAFDTGERFFVSVYLAQPRIERANGGSIVRAGETPGSGEQIRTLGRSLDRKARLPDDRRCPRTSTPGSKRARRLRTCAL